MQDCAAWEFNHSQLRCSKAGDKIQGHAQSYNIPIFCEDVCPLLQGQDLPFFSTITVKRRKETVIKSTNQLREGRLCSFNLVLLSATWPGSVVHTDIHYSYNIWRAAGCGQKQQDVGKSAYAIIIANHTLNHPILCYMIYSCSLITAQHKSSIRC